MLILFPYTYNCDRQSAPIPYFAAHSLTGFHHLTLNEESAKNGIPKPQPVNLTTQNQSIRYLVMLVRDKLYDTEIALVRMRQGFD